MVSFLHQRRQDYVPANIFEIKEKKEKNILQVPHLRDVFHNFDSMKFSCIILQDQFLFSYFVVITLIVESQFPGTFWVSEPSEVHLRDKGFFFPRMSRSSKIVSLLWTFPSDCRYRTKPPIICGILLLFYAFLCYGNFEYSSYCDGRTGLHLQFFSLNTVTGAFNGNWEFCSDGSKQ